MSEKELPQGWAWAKVGDVAGSAGLFCDGDWVETKDQDPNGEVRLIQLADVGDGAFLDKSARYMTTRRANELSCTYLRSGDVLVSRMADPIARACIFPSLDRRCVTVVDVAIVRPGAHVDRRWLMHAINAPPFRVSAEGAASGTTRARISRANLGELSLPLPPLAEQLRIVAKLDELLARSRRAREVLAEVPALLERYRQSVLARATANGAAPQVKLRTVVENLDQGWSPQCEPEAVGADDAWAVIKTTAVQPLYFDDAQNKRLPSNLLPRPHLEIAAGDVLITRAGPRARAGICCHVPAVRPKLMVCDKVYRLRVREDLVLPAYLALALNEPGTLRRIDALKSGISESGVNMTQEKLLELDIKLPPLPIQRHVVAAADDGERRARSLRATLDSVVDDIDRLDRSTLTRAFRGQLVPQDPNDEPASVMLECIRAERAAGDGAATKRGRRAKAER